MEFWRASRAGRAVIFVTLLVAISIGLFYLVPGVPSQVRMATAFKGTAFNYYGERYRKRLATQHIDLQLLETGGAQENLEILADSRSGVKIAFVNGGSLQGEPPEHVLSLGVIY